MHDPYLPQATGRADAVNLPLRREDLRAVTTFGRARHRYLVLVGSEPGTSGGVSSPANQSTISR